MHVMRKKLNTNYVLSLNSTHNDTVTTAEGMDTF